MLHTNAGTSGTDQYTKYVGATIDGFPVTLVVTKKGSITKANNQILTGVLFIYIHVYAYICTFAEYGEQ